MPLFLGFILGTLFYSRRRASEMDEELPKEIADIDISKLLDCPYCKFPAEVTHFVAYPQGSEMKYAFIAECFNQDSYVVTPEEVAGLD